MNIKVFICIILTSLFAFSSCNTESKNTEEVNRSLDAKIPDTLVYGVINYLISHEHLNPNLKSKYILEEDGMPFLFYFEHDSLSLTKLNTLYSKQDLQYIFSQRNQFAKFKIDSSQIKHKIVISYANFEKLGLQTYSTISFPLFNEKRTLFIIRTSYYCGALCATIGTYIYEKINSSWILIKTLNEAVS